MTGNFLFELLLIALPAAAGLFWWDGARAREFAIEHARRACARRNVQFLDQTVALTRIRPARTVGGSMVLQRHFGFEFTSHGAHRDRASVIMQGRRLVDVNFPYTRDADGNRVYQH